MITAEHFRAATGREPENDDLDRCNCAQTGPGHQGCGWNARYNRPVFEVGRATNDNCQVCHGARGGIPGNENRVNGTVMCDYCTMDAQRGVASQHPVAA